MISEKSKLSFSYVNDLRPRSRIDLNLEYCYTFIYLIIYLNLPTFRSQAALVSEKSTIFIFSYIKAQETKFDIVIKYVKVNPGLSFEQIMIGWSPRCYIASFVKIGPLVPEKIFEGVLPYTGMAAILVM